MNTITIKVDVSDEAMAGSAGWGSVDPAASIQAFVHLVLAAVKREYPTYHIRVEGTDYRNAIEIDDPALSGREYSDMQGNIQEILSEVYQGQGWVR